MRSGESYGSRHDKCIWSVVLSKRSPTTHRTGLVVSLALIFNVDSSPVNLGVGWLSFGKVCKFGELENEKIIGCCRIHFVFFGTRLQHNRCLKEVLRADFGSTEIGSRLIFV